MFKGDNKYFFYMSVVVGFVYASMVSVWLLSA